MCTCLIVLKLHFVLIFFDTALPPTLSLDRTTRPNYWLSRPTNSCGTEHDSVGVFDLAGFIMQAQDQQDQFGGSDDISSISDQVDS